MRSSPATGARVLDCRVLADPQRGDVRAAGPAGWLHGPDRDDVVGSLARPLTATFQPGDTSEGVRFHPGGFPALFGIPANELVDVRLPIAAVLPRFHSLRELAKDAPLQIRSPGRRRLLPQRAHRRQQALRRVAPYPGRADGFIMLHGARAGPVMPARVQAPAGRSQLSSAALCTAALLPTWLARLMR